MLKSNITLLSSVSLMLGVTVTSPSLHAMGNDGNGASQYGTRSQDKNRKRKTIDAVVSGEPNGSVDKQARLAEEQSIPSSTESNGSAAPGPTQNVGQDSSERAMRSLASAALQMESEQQQQQHVPAPQASAINLKDHMVVLYPKTPEGNAALKAAARQGKEDARDEMLKRFNSGSLKIDRETDLKDFFQFSNLEERILTKPGYVGALFRFFKEDDYKTHLPEIMQKIKDEADLKKTAIAQNNLGWMYQEGKGGLAQSDTEAVKYFQLAAIQGFAPAQHNLGCTYQVGKGVPQSDTEAVKYFQLSANQGYARTQTRLGWMYTQGKGGVPQSDTEAVKYFQLAAIQGFADAQFSLGVMYHHGKGVPQSDTEAVKWMLLSKINHPNTTPLIKKHLPLNPNFVNGRTNNFPLLAVVKKTLDDTKNKLGSSPAFLAPSGVKEIYAQWVGFETKLLEGLEILEGIKPGFMITAVTPSQGIRTNPPLTDKFFSINTWENQEYLTVGVQNCVIVEKFLRLMAGFDEGVLSASKSMTSLKRPYQANLETFGDLQNKLLMKATILENLEGKLRRTTDEEEQKKMIETQKSVQTQFNQLNEEVELAQLMKQKLDALEDQEKNATQATQYLKVFVKGTLGSRNHDFLEEYPLLR